MKSEIDVPTSLQTWLHIKLLHWMSRMCPELTKHETLLRGRKSVTLSCRLQRVGIKPLATVW